jgi:hypothetical protein
MAFLAPSFQKQTVARRKPISVGTPSVSVFAGQDDTPQRVAKMRADELGPISQPSATPTPASGLTRTVPLPPRPGANMSSGGSLTRNGLTRVIPPSARPTLDPNRGSSGGTMQRSGGPVITIPPSPANKPLQPPPAAPVVSPTTSAAPQTESNNPLTGTGNQQAAGTTSEINAPQDLGLVQRGSQIPAGSDSVEEGSTEQSGLFARTFQNPKSTDFYGRMVRRLFQDRA